jgi:hypothetical protein
MVFEVFTDQDHAVGAQTAAGPSAPVPAASLIPQQPHLMLAGQQTAAPQAAGPAVELATVNISSDLPGAEIEVDGVFIGSTPSAAKIAPGMHKISVRHGSAIWSRDLMVQPGGSVNVNAILKK